MTSYSTMPVQTNGSMFSSSIPGNEYGITNVSSNGRVNITVIPPNKMGRQLSPADFRGSPSDSGSSYGTHQQQRYFSNSSSPRSPPLSTATAAYNGNNSNNVNSSTVTSHRTVQSTTEYNPPANRGGQHRQLSAPQPAAIPSVPSGKEQNDLDDILRELLGETYTSPSPAPGNSSTTTTINNNHVLEDDSFVRERQQYTNPDGSTTTIEKRKYKAPNVTENVTINKTSSRKVHTSSTQNGSTSPDIDSSGVSWLQQQQMKLNQRQRTRDDVDSSHKQEVVRELKSVVDRRGFSSSDSEQGDGQTYYSQKDIIVNQQPIAYTVLIKPEEERRRQEELRQQQNETNLTKKSVTNVSHTHHTHYNFKDADDGSEQRTKIRELEDELRNVKLGLRQATVHKHEEERKVENKPPRPPKQEMEEEEILSFKPVGIASLESGTGQSFINTNTMRSGSEGRTMGGAHNTMGGAQNTMGGAHNGVGVVNPGMGGANYTGTFRSQPQSQYGMSTGPQRVVTESRQVQQSYSQGGQQMGGGVSPGLGYNQGNQQAMVNEDAMLGGHQHGGGGGGGGAMNTSGGGGNQRYGYNTSHSYHSGLNQGGQMGTLPHSQALHVNTGENRYATVGGQQSHSAGGQGQGQGHVQFTNGTTASDQHSGMQSYQQQQQSAAAAGLRSNAGMAAPGYIQGYGSSLSGFGAAGGGGFTHGMGYNTGAGTSVSHHNTAGVASSTMGGSRYNLHQAPPVSPGAASYHGAGYYHQPQHTGPPSVYHGGATMYGSRRGSMQSLVAASDVFGQFENGHVTAKFVKDTSKYWYKPTISRDEVINQLKDTVPGTFIVRDSNSFPGAFGLAVRVQQLPPNVQLKAGHDTSADYVRFYLIEPTSKGVKLKGCSNEPVFASLAALIYQHTITPLALPCKLLLPDPDRLTTFNSVMVDSVDGRMMGGIAVNGDITSSANDLLKHGAACNVVYLNNVDTESLTGPQAVSKAVQQTFSKGTVDTTIATFKASSDGITVTDTNHRLFFRQHFPRDSVSFCGVDPADRRFTQSLENGMLIKEAKMFGFVAKKKKGGNHCLLFAELDPEQPASAIVNFVTKVMMNK